MKHWGKSKFEMHPFPSKREDVSENFQVSISKNLALVGFVAAVLLAARDSRGSEPCNVMQRKKLVLEQKQCNAGLSNVVLLMQLCWVWECYFWHVAAQFVGKYWRVWTCRSVLVLLCC